jgi:hypothetical protein
MSIIIAFRPRLRTLVDYVKEAGRNAQGSVIA